MPAPSFWPLLPDPFEEVPMSPSSTKRTAKKSTKRSAPRAGGAAAASDSSNEVRLRGRLAAEPETRTLPSGDDVVTFRLIVGRRRSRDSKVSVDTIDCTVWSPSLRRKVAAWSAGETLQIEGALRRRFWRSPHGPRSRYDVEVTRASRASQASEG
jgi:single-strand DNA-binding protein